MRYKRFLKQMVKTHMGARQTHRAPPDPPSERSGWHELQQVEPHHTLPDDLGGQGGAQWLVARIVETTIRILVYTNCTVVSTIIQI